MSDLRKGWKVQDASNAQKDRAESEKKDAARKARIERAKSSPEFFCEYYLRQFFSHPETGKFTGLADWQERTHKLAKTEPQVAVAAPRGHGKTTFVSFALTLRDLLIGESLFTIYIGPTHKAAADRIEEIRQELENNERIREDFGDLLTGEGVDGAPRQPRGQRHDDLSLANGSRILARGCGQSLRGAKHKDKRPDRIILDDVDKDEEAASKDRVDKRIRWFKRVVLGLQGAAGMRVFVVGNIIARYTLLTECLKMKGFASLVFRAVLEDGTPLMPEMWTLEKLSSIREQIGTDAFETEYQNNPPSESSRPFREEWLRRRWTREQLAQTAFRVIAALDLSKGKSERSDFQAMVAIVRDDKGTIYILKADINRRTRTELGNRLFTFSDAIGFESIVSFVIEINGFQEWFSDEVKERSASEGKELPIFPVENRLAKYDRISKVAPIAEGGRLLFPPEDEEDESIKLLRRQLEEFPDGRHDDGPDALAMAVEESARLVRGSGAIVLNITPHDREGSTFYFKPPVMAATEQ
ncbi:phage terminase large subunit [Candidatus Sumerlaeota bacterium]|nr:phage terminase large subunit [Candidatus Sumerlaeota bacterium]